MAVKPARVNSVPVSGAAVGVGSVPGQAAVNNSSGEPPAVSLTHIGKRAAQVGGLAVAAYVIAAVASGQAAADTEAASSSQTGSGTSSAQRSDTSVGDDDRDASTSVGERSGRGDAAATSPPTEAESDNDSDRESAKDDIDDAAAGEDRTAERGGVGTLLDSTDSTSRGSGAGDDAPATARRDDEREEVRPGAEDGSLADDDEPTGAASGSEPELKSAVGSSPAAVPSVSTTDHLEVSAPVARTTVAPTAPAQTDVELTLLGWMRRTLFNQSPVVRYDTSLNVQDMSDGVITGNIGAVDPEGDKLTYTVLAGPGSGTLVVDELTGEFTFTPNETFAQSGGVDFFHRQGQ